jgi:hypothetical protein
LSRQLAALFRPYPFDEFGFSGESNKLLLRHLAVVKQYRLSRRSTLIAPE